VEVILPNLELNLGRHIAGAPSALGFVRFWYVVAFLTIFLGVRRSLGRRARALPGL